MAPGGLFCAPGSDMKWSDDRLEILIAKRSQPDRKARIAINAGHEHGEFPVSRVSWDAKDGTTYAIANIHTGKKARLRNHRISLSRLKEQDPEIVAGSLAPDQMIQQWLRMMEGGNLPNSQKALGRRLHKMWIDDEAQDGNKSSQ